MDEKQEEVIREIRRVASLLGSNSLSQSEFGRHSRLSTSTIKGRFGSWTAAIEAAGLTPNPQGPPSDIKEIVYTDDELLLEIVNLTQKLGKIPSSNEMYAIGKFSLRPYRDRWGTWTKARRTAYALFGNPLEDETDVSVPVSNTDQSSLPSRRKTRNTVEREHPKVQYGEPIDFRGLRHAPVNEQGVVYLFGMVSRELGFLIESLRTAFPDCEGKYCVDDKKLLWEHVLIEFEFRSSNFKVHGHDPNGCDFIVCWIHDWDDCPIDVIELRSQIPCLPK